MPIALSSAEVKKKGGGIISLDAQDLREKNKFLNTRKF